MCHPRLGMDAQVRGDCIRVQKEESLAQLTPDVAICYQFDLLDDLIFDDLIFDALSNFFLKV